jgi:hypothetical protein
MNVETRQVAETCIFIAFCSFTPLKYNPLDLFCDFLFFLVSDHIADQSTIINLDCKRSYRTPKFLVHVIHLLDTVILGYVSKSCIADVDSQVNVLAILRINFLVFLSSNSSQKHLRLHHNIIIIHDKPHVRVRSEISLAIAVKPLE